MKFATLDNGSPDGELFLVSRNLEKALCAADIAPNLREAVERWQHCMPALKQRAELLEAGKSAGIVTFQSAQAKAPLPRSFQWLDGSAFRSHGERMVQAFNVMPETLKAEQPLMYQGCSDRFYGPAEDFPVPAELNIDLEAEVTVITDHVPMATTAAEAQDKILLLMLANDVSLRALIYEMNLGFGMVRCKPSTAFSPVAITPDELGAAWGDGRAHLPIHATVNSEHLGHPNAGEMQYSFYDLIAHAASTRALSAGTIIGSGTISNFDEATGVTCISEQRALEKLRTGTPSRSFLRFGDRVRIEAFDAGGDSIFGAIDHRMVELAAIHNLRK